MTAGWLPPILCMPPAADRPLYTGRATGPVKMARSTDRLAVFVDHYWYGRIKMLMRPGNVRCDAARPF